MIKAALITYDLKNIKPGDNANAKEALLQYANTFTAVKTSNALSLFMEEVVLKLPDTTIAATIDAAVTSPKAITEEVISIIQKVGATPDKVYVAFVDSDYCWNSTKLLA